jgi:hypothetical protein
LTADFETTANFARLSSASGVTAITTASGLDIGIGMAGTSQGQELSVLKAGSTYATMGVDGVAQLTADTNVILQMMSSLSDTSYGEVFFGRQNSAGRGGFRYQHGTTGADEFLAMRAGNANIFSTTGEAHLRVHTFVSAPTLSACGTSPTITGTDNAGKITIGTGTVTSCTATFRTAFASAPACVVNGDNSAVTYANTTSTTVLTITSSADMNSDVLSYICLEIV